MGSRDNTLDMATLDHFGQHLARAPQVLLDVLLPPRCLGCGEGVAAAGSLCSDCWSKAAFIAPPVCACCGFPFGYEMGADALCANCAGESPAYDRARAVLRYDEGSKGLVLGFKHGDRTEGAKAYAEWLERAGAELLAQADLLVPVPLHWRRLLKRRYNQAALLCHALGERCGVPVCPDLLVRRRNTPSQGRLSAAARQRNVQGAFALNPRCADRVIDRHVVLIDDVMTSGATVSACARVLKRAKAAEVSVLVVTRVVRGGDGG